MVERKGLMKRLFIEMLRSDEIKVLLNFKIFLERDKRLLYTHIDEMCIVRIRSWDSIYRFAGSLEP